jgi:hypothetical protein
MLKTKIEKRNTNETRKMITEKCLYARLIKNEQTNKQMFELRA